MNIKDIKGLKYPDEYFTKFFFKNKLNEKRDFLYLEFGCGNGSNLMLPYSYGEGNKIIGVDYNTKLIEHAKYNFHLHNNQESQYNFYAEDMREFAKTNRDIQADVFLLPSVIYYINKEDFILFLSNMIKNNNIKNNIPFYIRVRTPKDFRFGLGVKQPDNSFLLPENVITGEGNTAITFYTQTEIIKILEKHLNLREFKVFQLDNQNDHNGEIILNSDMVIWGTIN